MNKPPRSIITPERLINLFTLFVVGTLTTVLLLYLPKETTISWWQSFLLGLRFTTFITYEIVILSILGHYITRGKEKLLNEFDKNPKKFYYGLLGILGISIVILAYFSAGNGYLNAVLYFVSLLFMILVVPLNKGLNKLYEKYVEKKK